MKDLKMAKTNNESIDEVASVEDTRHQPAWVMRRRIILTTLLYCALASAYIIFKGTDSRVYETVIMSSFGLAGMVIGSYVFGAVWDDKSRREMTTSRASSNININSRRK
jgi:hypothetical protein